MSKRFFQIELAPVTRGEQSAGACSIPDGRARTALTLKMRNDSLDSLFIKTLVISFRHALDEKSFSAPFSFQQRAGDIITLDAACELTANSCISLTFHAVLPTSWRYSDYPAGLYAVDQNGQPHSFDYQGEKPARRYLQGAAVTQLCLIPQPQELRELGQSIACPLLFNISALPAGLQSWYTRLNKRATPALVWSEQGFPVRLVYDESMSAEQGAYRIEISAQACTIICAPQDQGALCAACASVAQILFQSTQIGVLPALIIQDRACYAYRGFMLDVARNFLAASELLEWLDLCALLKLNRLHLHLSDDEGWRLEIPGQPHLIENGAWRGHGLVLPPHYSADPRPSGGYLSVDDCKALRERAQDLGIELIPEINFPSHARALLKAKPRTEHQFDFAHYSSASCYESVQYFSDNVLRLYDQNQPFALVDMLTHLLVSAAQAFGSKVVHCGGDEIPNNAWGQDRHMQALKQSLGRNGDAMPSHSKQSDHAALGWFYAALYKRLRAQDIHMALWDDAAQALLLGLDQAEQSNVALYCWNDYQGQTALAQLMQQINTGLVLCPASHCYFDHPHTTDKSDPGLTWAQPALSLEQVFNWEIEAKQIPKSQILGVQANLWSELCATPEDFYFMSLPRLFAFAERSWRGGAKQGDSYQEFAQKALGFGQWLAKLRINVRDHSLQW